MKRLLYLGLLALLLPLPVLSLPAMAQTILPSDAVRVEVLPGWRDAKGYHTAGLRLRLEEGWKTYWRAPGDAGIPPMIAITSDTNLGEIEYLWPVPEVFHQNGMRSIGYSDEVVLPVRFDLGQNSQAANVSGTMQIGVCQDICVPVHLTFEADLPIDGRRDPALIAALVDGPTPAARAGVGEVRCALSPNEHGFDLRAIIDVPAQSASEDMVIETANPQIYVSEPQLTRSGNDLTATAILRHPSGPHFAVDRAGLRFTLIGDGTAIDIQGCSAQ